MENDEKLVIDFTMSIKVWFFVSIILLCNGVFGTYN